MGAGEAGGGRSPGAQEVVQRPPGSHVGALGGHFGIMLDQNPNHFEANFAAGLPFFVVALATCLLLSLLLPCRPRCSGPADARVSAYKFSIYIYICYFYAYSRYLDVEAAIQNTQN